MRVADPPHERRNVPRHQLRPLLEIMWHLRRTRARRAELALCRGSTPRYGQNRTPLSPPSETVRAAQVSTGKHRMKAGLSSHVDFLGGVGGGIQMSNRAKPGGSEYDLVQIWCKRY